MPSLDLKKKQIRYAATDERALTTAVTLCEAMTEYDQAVKLDATTARVALGHLLEHVRRQRSGKLVEGKA